MPRPITTPVVLVVVVVLVFMDLAQVARRELTEVAVQVVVVVAVDRVGLLARQARRPPTVEALVEMAVHMVEAVVIEVSLAITADVELMAQEDSQREGLFVLFGALAANVVLRHSHQLTLALNFLD